MDYRGDALPDGPMLYEPGEHSSFSIQETGAGYRAIRDYTDLRVWHLAMDLAVAIYALTQAFPPDERFGLSSQLRRAGVSVPSNIAKGNARNSTADYLRFLRLARGSLAEIKTQLLIATRLGYLDAPASAATLSDIEDLTRQLTSLCTAIERAASRPASNHT